MNVTPRKIARAVATALFGASLAIGAAALSAQPYGEGGRGAGPRAGQMTEADRAQMRERMQQRMNERLDRMATRLDIKTNQQSAWEDYRRTITSMFQDRPQRPARDADAATLTRFRADMAQRRAQHLATLADATARLQQALEPEQRKALAEIAQRMGPGGKRGGGGFHRGHGEGSVRS